ALEEPPRNPAEGAVREQGHDVTGTRELLDPFQDPLVAPERLGDPAACADRRGNGLDVEHFARGQVSPTERGEERDVRGGERGRIVVLMEFPTRRCAARLEHGDEASFGMTRAKREQRLPNGGRMMREIVVDVDAARRT